MPSPRLPLVSGKAGESPLRCPIGDAFLVALVQGRADTEAIELRLSSSQAAKDREIDRLSNSLYDAQRESDYAKRRLEQVHNHTAMQNQRRTRKDALAELADLEGQLAQTQVSNLAASVEAIGSHIRRCACNSCASRCTTTIWRTK